MGFAQSKRPVIRKTTFQSGDVGLFSALETLDELSNEDCATELAVGNRSQLLAQLSFYKGRNGCIFNSATGYVFEVRMVVARLACFEDMFWTKLGANLA